MVSQQILEWVEQEKLQIAHFDTACIQPSSFEPLIGGRGYILDAEQGLFRPTKDATIEESLAKLSTRDCVEFSTKNGYELKKGFAYLFPLDAGITLAEGEYVKSSPKSSIGRIFVHVRLLTDYHPNFDEVHAHFSKGRSVKLWVLVQPLVFNIIIRPGVALNQLRFFHGYGARLDAAELRTLCDHEPLLLTQDRKPATHIITEDGLWLHLFVPQEGIGGLRARHNPHPIDLAQKNEYDPLAYFEPITACEGRIKIRKGEHYLLSSQEVLTIPATINSELRSHSHIGLQGPLHFAGFIDNGFVGDLVLELRSEEITDVILEDGLPIGLLDIFRTEQPDRLYGEEIGSHYYAQKGLRIAKFFKEL